MQVLLLPATQRVLPLARLLQLVTQPADLHHVQRGLPLLLQRPPRLWLRPNPPEDDERQEAAPAVHLVLSQSKPEWLAMITSQLVTNLW